MVIPETQIWYCGFYCSVCVCVCVCVFLCWVFVVYKLSLAAASRGYSWSPCTGFSLWWLLLWSAGSRVVALGLSSSAACGIFPDTGVTDWSLQAQRLWPKGLGPPQRVGSSQTRDWTGVPWISRQILIQCTTREVLALCFDAHWRFGLRGHWPYTRDGRAVDYI